MSETLEFDHLFPYRPPPASTEFPIVPVTLIGPSGAEDSLAILDTGAAYSLFDGRRADALGIHLLRGREIRMTSLGGAFAGRLHPVVLTTVGVHFSCEVVFSLAPLPRELLGRHSLFEQVAFPIRERFHSVYFRPRP